MKKLAKCSVCGHITTDAVMYGSMFLCDEYPSECPHICSSNCMDQAVLKIESGEWFVPTLRKACGGYTMNISKPRRGYDKQPSQNHLLEQLIQLQNQ